MCIGKTFERFDTNVNRDTDRRKFAARRERRFDSSQIHSVDEFHGEQESLVGTAEIKYLDDIGVVERHCKLGLSNETIHKMGIARAIGQDALDRDDLAKAVLTRDLGNKN